MATKTNTSTKTANAASREANTLAAEAEARRAEIEQTSPPTPESVNEAITSAMDHAASAFTELELRVRGDNGSLYRIADDDGKPLLPEGTEGMGVEVVNALAFLQESLTGTLCWKLEKMLEDNTKRAEQERANLVGVRRAIEAGRATEGLEDSKLRFIETLEYQHALLVCAFDAACNAYEANMGKPFLTRAEREAEAIRARRARNAPAKAAPSSRAARFKAQS